MRGVHLIREAFSVVASGYVYTKNLQPFEEVPPDEIRGAMLRQMSVEDGVRCECQYDAEHYLPQLGLSAEVISQNRSGKLSSILQVRYDEWMRDYDNVSRTIFSHLLVNESSATIDELVERAASYDLSRQSESEVDANHHVTDREEKENASSTLEDLYRADEPCAQYVALTDARMGYDLPFSRAQSLGQVHKLF